MGLQDEMFRLIKFMLIMWLFVGVAILVYLFNVYGRTTSIEGDFVVVDKSDIVNSRNWDYQYVTLENESGEKYVVKANVYESNRFSEGDVVDARFKAIAHKDMVECNAVTIKLKESEEE